jgi:hypothetical protein
MIGDYHLYGYWDIFLVPFFYFLFRFLIRLSLKDETDPWYKKQASIYLNVKLIAAIVFALLLIFVTPGDSQLYFNAAMKVKKRIIETGDIGLLFRDFTTLGDSFWTGQFDDIGMGLMDAVANTLPVRIATVMSFFCLDSFIVINMMFGLACGFLIMRPIRLLAYSGDKILARLLFYSFLIPSFVYWSSGLMKDTICVSCMALVLYAAFAFYYEKRVLVIFPFILSTIVLYIAKPYIALTFVPIVLMMLYLLYILKIKSKVMATFVLVIVSFAIVLIGINSDTFSEILDENINSTVALSENFKFQSENAEGSFFSYGEIDPSLSGILKKAPLAISTVFYRPFIWEAKKIITMLSSFEGFLFMLITLLLIFKAGPVRFSRILFTDPFCVPFLFFILVFALFTGLSTPNFGSLARYKIPCLPFYLFIILQIARELPKPPKLFSWLFRDVYRKETPEPTSPQAPR